MPATKIAPPSEYASISYYEFVEFIDTVKLYSDEEMIEILRKSDV